MLDKIRKAFSMGPDLTQETVVEMEQKRQVLANLIASSGWTWMQSQLVEMANDTAESFSKGGHSLETYTSLSARLRLLGELLELPGNKLFNLEQQLKEIRKAGPLEQEIDPVDLDPMSPVPDERLYDYREDN